MATRELRISHRLTSNHICHLPSTIHHSRLLSALPACLPACEPFAHSVTKHNFKLVQATNVHEQSSTAWPFSLQLSKPSKLYCLNLFDDLKISYELETVKYLEKRLKFCSKRYFLNVLPKLKELQGEKNFEFVKLVLFANLRPINPLE